MKPIAIDLCCGMGGWADGLLAAGYRCIGFDVKNWGYPGNLVVADVRNLDGQRFRGASLIVASPPCQEFSYRSFPFKKCRDLRDNVPPDKSIWEACVRIASEARLPLVLENVRGAERYMGRAAARFGSYYLWGDVPVLLPDGAPRKGFYSKNDPGGLNAARAMHRSSSGRRMGKQQAQDLAEMGRGPQMAQQRDAAARNFAPNKDRERDRVHGHDFEAPRRRKIVLPETTAAFATLDKSIPWMERRRMWSAQVAKVPFELGYFIGNHYRGIA